MGAAAALKSRRKERDIMARSGDSLAYEMKAAALGEKSRNPNQSITDRDTIHSYKSSINRFCAWAKEEGYSKEQILSSPREHLQEYTNHLKEEGLSSATIHTYIAAPCKGLGVPMQHVSKPQRSADDITRSRGGGNPQGQREMQDSRFERLVDFQKVTGLRRAELKDLKGEDLRIKDGKMYVIAQQGKGRTRQWVIDDSLKMLDKVIGDRFGLIPPISFYGKTHTKENAHELFAMVIDVDYVGKQQLKNLLKQFGNGVQLRPTYLVSSGKGVHLYYFLQEPVQLYRNREKVLAELKEAFIRRLWNDTSSIRPDSPDITGIYQGFRCVGSQSKLGADFPVKAYKLSENRYTLEDIKASIPSCKVDLAPLYEKPRRKSTVTLEEAKELYPEWYEKRIVQGEPKQKSKKQGGTWVCNEALYEWWKRKITEEVKAGGRYFSIMALCSYGLKCGISEQKIRRDAYAFLEHLESLTEDEDNHFSRADVKDALRALKGDRKRLSTIASREWIEDNTKVTIPANKRNYRKQEVHLARARAVQDIDYPNHEWAGRPNAEQTVREWQESHPAGKKADCIRETGLSKPTVYKWWK